MKTFRFSPTASLVIAVTFLVTAFAEAADDPNPAEVARMRYELEKVEHAAKISAGKPFDWSESERKIFRQLQEFAQKYPGDEKVKALIERGKVAYQASGGNRFVITEEMLAYRDRGEKIESAIGSAADKAWAALQEEQKALLIEKPFPAPDPLDVDETEMIGKRVLLEGIRYEEQLFVENGCNYVAAGDPTKGCYFIAGSSQRFNALFEAMRRYRTAVKETLPAEWSFVCELNGPEMLTPGGGGGGALGGGGEGFSSHVGWTANPIAIYIPGTLFVSLDETHDQGASFAGEAELSNLLSFSITEIPDKVTPEGLVRLYVVAVKEKNFDLHIECHDPSNRHHPGQIQTLRYYWEMQQKGLEREHAHAEPVEVGKIRVVQGGEDKGLDSFFGDPNKGGKKALPKIERVTVSVQLYNADGIQTVRPRLVTLNRKEGGRWYIESGGTLTF